MVVGGMDFLNVFVVGGELLILCFMIFVLLDGEWLMNIYLGILFEVGFEDVFEDVVGNVKFLFFEGYFYDKL